MSNLDNFIKKMYELQYSDKEQVYSEQQLKKIALDTGLSEAEWNASQETMRNHVENGEQHLTHQNYDGAVYEFEQATNLNPFSAKNNFNLALAHYKKWTAEGNIFSLGKAQEFADKSLNLQAGYTPAIQLLAKINKASKRSKSNSAKKMRMAIIGVAVGFGLLLLISLTSYISIKNKVVVMEENVSSKWAQVENVYQRRADLIPQLVETVKATADYEKETLLLVVEARNQAVTVNVDATSLSADELADFQAKQDELTQALNKFLAISEDYPELQATQAFRDLQAQIEGTENRITVERRRFNEEVKVYNSYIKKFPQSMFGFDEKAYFEVSKKAFDTPDLEL